MDDATPFLQNVTLPNLRFFELTAPQATIHSLEYFLQRHPYLEYLDISHCKLLGEFQGSISYHQIKFLFAEDCFACDWVKEGLVARKFPRIRILDISINVLEATEAIRLELADIVALGIDGRCVDPDGLVLPPLEFLSINGLDAIRSFRSSPVLQAKAIWNRFPRAGTSTNFTKVVDARAIRALDCSFNPELTNLVGCLPDLGNTQLLVCDRSIDWNGALPSSLRCFLGGSDGFRNELVSRNIAAHPCPDGLERPGFPHLSMPRCLSFDG